MQFADNSFNAKFLSFLEAHSAAGFERLEEKLLDAEWINEWSAFLHRLYARELSKEVMAQLPPELALPELRSPASLEETPDRFISPIEHISGSAGLEALVEKGPFSRRVLREILLHPAAVVDLHLALCTSDKRYWIERVEAAIRRKAAGR